MPANTSVEVREGTVSITLSAFYGCSGLISIKIPESVTSIGKEAFHGCSGLISIKIPESVTSIGKEAFYGCSSLTAIVIPEGVTSIGDYAFDNCTALKKVIIEDGSTTLSLGYNYYYNNGSTGQGLFYDCPLEEVYLGRNLSYSSGSSYGYSPFYNNDALIKVTIGNEVTEISQYAFYDCDNIYSLTIPNGVLSIGSSAFSTPDKVIWLTNTPPTGYTNAKGKINYVANNQYTSLSNVEVYPYLSSMFEVDGVRYVPVSPSERTCHAIDCVYGDAAATINVGETASFKGVAMTVKEVMPYAFYGNKHIKEVNISHKGNIGNYAFYDCDSVQNVELSNEGNVGSWAFYDCDGIKSLDISNVGYVGDGAFRGCGALETAIVANTGAVNSSAFYNCVSLKSATLGDKVTSLGNDAFRGCTSLQEIVIPNSVKSVGTYCFYGCTAMKSAVIGDGMTNVMEYTFAYCGLEKIIIGDNITSIGNYAFKGCRGMKSAVLGNGLTKVNGTMFNGCIGLENVEIGNKVTELEANAFSGCSSLPTITIPQTMTKIGDNVFVGCSKLADVIIADRTTALTLGSNGSSPMFADCPLDSVYIGGKITYNTTSGKGYSPFYRNTSLRTVVITDREGQIYDNEFYGCTNLQDVTIGNGVKSIGNYAFSGCSSLEGFSFGSNMETIGAEAFSDCTSLTSITSHAAVPPACGAQALDDINKWSCTLRVPSGYAAAYQTADQWKEFFFVEDVVEVAKYKLTFMIDGEVYYTDSLVHKAEVTVPEVPEREGHTFSGWGEVPETMPAEDVTISGFFTINRYLVTFVIDGEVIASDSLEYGASIVAPVAPEKEGHTFNGWGEVAETVPAENVTYYGGYSVNSYLLSYVVDGETVQSDSVAYGTAIVALEEPTKAGHTFSGWGEVPETMPAEDVTISGFFTINRYLVTFVIDGEVIASDSLEYGASIVAPVAPEKEGHTFDGWGEVAETVPAEDVTYYGSYSVNSYLLTYVVDGETVQSDSVAYGSTIVALEEPTKEGHTFSGWSEIPETMPAEDVTISGFFTVNRYLVTFVIDDEVITSDSLEYGASIVAPVAPEKEGHTFDGWGEVAEMVPAEDVTYYGSYSVNSYLLTYVVDGETVQSDSVAYGTAIVALEEPTKEGYTFSGWSEIPETMPAEDVVISGTFTVNTYKVYYYVGDELVHTAEVAYGEAIPEYVYEPTAEGDVFVGWVGETYETMPAHDVTYTANIESGIDVSILDPRQTVIYDLNGRKILVDDLRELERGVYIIDNKKVVIK